MTTFSLASTFSLSRFTEEQLEPRYKTIPITKHLYKPLQQQQHANDDEYNNDYGYDGTLVIDHNVHTSSALLNKLLKGHQQKQQQHHQNSDTDTDTNKDGVASCPQCHAIHPPNGNVPSPPTPTTSPSSASGSGGGIGNNGDGQNNNTNNQNQTTIALIGNVETFWHAEVDIGSPAQTFQLDFDTGSSNLWVQSTLCNDVTTDFEHCSGKFPLYDSSQSSSYQSAGGTLFSLCYGIGFACGIAGTETINIGGFEVQNQPFAAAYATDTNFVSTNMAGIVGLAFQELAAEDLTTVTRNLFSQHPDVEPVYSFYLPEDPKNNTGELIIGGINHKHIVGPLTSSPVTQEKYWQTFMLQFKVGDVVVVEDVKTILDSGTTMIYIDDASFNSFLRITGLPQGIGQRKDLLCSFFDDLPNLTFNLARNNWILGPQNYALPQQIGPITDVSRCVLGIANPQSLSFKQWIFGDVFMRAVYTVFDYKYKRLRFGKIKGTLSDVPTNDGIENLGTEWHSYIKYTSIALVAVTVLAFIVAFVYSYRAGRREPTTDEGSPADAENRATLTAYVLAARLGDATEEERLNAQRDAARSGRSGRGGREAGTRWWTDDVGVLLHRCKLVEKHYASFSQHNVTIDSLKGMTEADQWAEIGVSDPAEIVAIRAQLTDSAFRSLIQRKHLKEARFTARLERFYNHYNPAKVPEIPSMIKKYDETKVFEALIRRYGPEPEGVIGGVQESEPSGLSSSSGGLPSGPSGVNSPTLTQEEEDSLTVPEWQAARGSTSINNNEDELEEEDTAFPNPADTDESPSSASAVPMPMHAEEAEQREEQADEGNRDENIAQQTGMDRVDAPEDIDESSNTDSTHEDALTTTVPAVALPQQQAQAETIEKEADIEEEDLASCASDDSLE